MTKVFQMRVEEEWEGHLDATIRDMAAFKQEPPSRAAFVRETIEMENLLWRRSPYICDTSSHFVLVTRDASFLYLRSEQLHLRADLQTIPAHLETRLEKLASPSLWGLNAFLLRHGGKIDIKSDATDGASSKSVYFDGPFIEGLRVKREGCFMLREYANSKPKNNDPREFPYDRADFEIDIPTRSLDILMVLDPLLYANDPGLDRPKLKFDIRNRDGVAFSSADAIGQFLRSSNLVRIGNSYEPGMESGRDDLYKETIRLARDKQEEYVNVLKVLEGSKADSGITAEQIQRAGNLMKLPERFLFYRVSWTGAHIGLTCSIRFPRPQSAQA